jgi:hypothetical protein
MSPLNNTRRRLFRAFPCPLLLVGAEAMHFPQTRSRIDDFQAMRSPDEAYPHHAVAAIIGHQKRHKGGFYHDGRFATLGDVVNQDRAKASSDTRSIPPSIAAQEPAISALPEVELIFPQAPPF